MGCCTDSFSQICGLKGWGRFMLQIPNNLWKLFRGRTFQGDTLGLDMIEIFKTIFRFRCHQLIDCICWLGRNVYIFRIDKIHDDWRPMGRVWKNLVHFNKSYMLMMIFLGDQLLSFNSCSFVSRHRFFPSWFLHLCVFRGYFSIFSLFFPIC